MIGLIKRGNIWFARLYIPEDRWADVGKALGAPSGLKREIVRTLATPSKREAQKRAAEAEKLMRDKIEQALRRAKLPALGDWTAAWHERAAALREDLDTRGLAVVGWETEADGSQIPVRRWETIKDDAREAAEVVRHRQGHTAAEKFVRVATLEGLSVGQGARQWLEDEGRRLKPATIASYKAAFEKLAVFLSTHHSLPSLDATEFTDITRKIAGEFIRHQRAASSAGTVQRDFAAYSGLWRWAIRRGHTEMNPWLDQTAGLKTLRTDDDDEAKRAFATSELVTLLRARKNALAPNRGGLGATFWDAMRLALLTGARASELLNLPVSGVIEDGTAIVVAADPKKGGKTKAAPRIIPLHPIAQQVVKARMDALPDLASDAPLFPELPQGGYNKSRSKVFSTRFVVLRRRLLGDNNEVNFHSFRRTWRTYAETATHHNGRLNDALIDLMFGHKRGSLGLDLYSDWTRLGRPQMAGKMAAAMTTLREAMDDVMALGMPQEVSEALAETQEDRPVVVRMKPAFRR